MSNEYPSPKTFELYSVYNSYYVHAKNSLYTPQMMFSFGML